MKVKKVISFLTAATISLSANFSAFIFTDKTTNLALQASAASISPYVDYAKALQYSLYLYDANMSGSLVSENCALTWRGDCFMQDASAPLRWTDGNPQNTPSNWNVDGGFHDAGDHVKYVVISAQAFSTLIKSRIAFPSAFKETKQDEHLKKLLDYECDFLMKCIVYDNSNRPVGFVYQVADGSAVGEDHQYWAPPETQGNLIRTAFTSKRGSRDALYVLEKTKEIYHNDNSEFANKLSSAITALQSLGDGAPKSYEGNYPADSDYNVNVNLNSAVNVSPEISYNGNVELRGWDWGKLRWTCNYMFEDLCRNSNWGNAAATVDWIFGNNERSQCFVTGYYNTPTNVGSRQNVLSPQNPHHRAADGHIFTSTTDNPAVYHDVVRNQSAQPTKFNGDNINILIGALVGGPDGDSIWQYVDNQCNYVCNEVALDFNAGFVGSLAGLYVKYGSGCSIVDEASIPGVIPNKANSPYIDQDSGSETVLLGDIDKTEIIDVFDMLYMRRELLKPTLSSYHSTPYDINQDGQFNTADCSELAKYILYKN